ncbi:uncharacterized protein LOC135400503 [Ornithodoros turicata]|uniref:uncharacterized protein LOC135400503 n=1 Tax=Ornithodoros turicata TaxID=34597 RepID=UPI0031395431
MKIVFAILVAATTCVLSTDGLDIKSIVTKAKACLEMKDDGQNTNTGNLMASILSNADKLAKCLKLGDAQEMVNCFINAMGFSGAKAQCLRENAAKILSSSST